MTMTIEPFTTAQLQGAMPQLCALLTNIVNDGASIGFLTPLDDKEVTAYWTKIAPEVDAGERITLVATEGDQIVGVGQLALETRANGNHRAEVQKVMVHTDWRRRGIAVQIMNELEESARKLNRTLLVLDTRLGDSAEQLYQKLGYIRAAEIPNYVTNSNGEYESTVIYYKIL